MTSTVNCYISKATFTSLEITCDLLTIHIGDVIWSPFLNYSPSEVVCDPVLSPECGHRAISVTGILKHLVAALKDGIDPVRGVLERSVVKFISAQIPNRRLGLDV